MCTVVQRTARALAVPHTTSHTRTRRPFSSAPPSRPLALVRRPDARPSRRRRQVYDGVTISETSEVSNDNTPSWGASGDCATFDAAPGNVVYLSGFDSDCLRGHDSLGDTAGTTIYETTPQGVRTEALNHNNGGTVTFRLSLTSSPSPPPTSPPSSPPLLLPPPLSPGAGRRRAILPLLAAAPSPLLASYVHNMRRPDDGALQHRQLTTAGYTVYNEQACEGRNELSTTSPGSVAACQALCDDASTCVSFEWSPSSKCQRSTSCVPAYFTSSSGWVSAARLEPRCSAPHILLCSVHTRAQAHTQ